MAFKPLSHQFMLILLCTESLTLDSLALPISIKNKMIIFPHLHVQFQASVVVSLFFFSLWRLLMYIFSYFYISYLTVKISTGTARTSLVITIGPSPRHRGETASTIMFGQRVGSKVSVLFSRIWKMYFQVVSLILIHGDLPLICQCRYRRPLAHSAWFSSRGL